MQIALGILGGEYGQDEIKGGKNFPLNLPTVRLGILPTIASDLEITKIYIAYLDKNRQLLESILKYIEEYKKNRTNGEKTISIEPIVLECEKQESDPHDPDKTFQVLSKLMKEVQEKSKPDLVYLHLGTGSHIQQLTFYRFADRQILSCPTRLIQTYLDHDEKIGYKIPRLRLYRHSPAKKINKELENACEELRNSLGGGNDKWEMQIKHLAEVALMTDDPILLLGETGTGKSFLAYQIHQLWIKRKHQESKKTKFHKVNCGGLTKELAQSEIFGHEEGAFTGATRKRRGMMELADKGTLFLDEIGDLDPIVQRYLLTAIEEKKFYPIGSEEPIESNFRLICASNRNLKEDIHAGHFRKDLYSRIRHWVFELPPLRERAEALPELTRRFLDTWFEKNQKQHNLVTYRQGLDLSSVGWTTFLQFAQEAKWSGNIRDLQNAINHMATLTTIRQEPEITEEAVKETIEYLQQVWEENRIFQKEEIYSFLQNICKEQYPENSFMDGVELLLQDMALDRYNNHKGKAGKELYLKPNESLSNPADKLSQRYKILMKKR